MEDASRVVLGLLDEFKVPLASVRGNGADMAGLWEVGELL